MNNAHLIAAKAQASIFVLLDTVSLEDREFTDAEYADLSCWMQTIVECNEQATSVLSSLRSDGFVLP